eukprot:188609_1
MSSMQLDGLEFVRRGSAMLKYGRHGVPHFRHVELSFDNSRVVWYSRNKKKSETEIKVADICEIVDGQFTSIFRRFPSPGLAHCSFSILYNENTKTLDLIAKTQLDFEMWTKTLRELVRQCRDRQPEVIEKLNISVPSFIARTSNINPCDIGRLEFTNANASVFLPPHTSNVKASSLRKRILSQEKTVESLDSQLQSPSMYQSPERQGCETELRDIQTSITEGRRMLGLERLLDCDHHLWRLSVLLDTLGQKIEVVQVASLL